mgnify:CR=1 FL=1|jgi:hypothetical protein
MSGESEGRIMEAGQDVFDTLGIKLPEKPIYVPC